MRGIDGRGRGRDRRPGRRLGRFRSSGSGGRDGSALRFPGIEILGLAHDQHALADSGRAARIVLRPLDDDRAGKAHQHLRLDLAMHVRVIPVEAGGHVGRDMVMIGEGTLPAIRRADRRIGAGHQDLVLRRHRRNGKAVNMEIGRAGGRMMRAGNDRIISGLRRHCEVGGIEVAGSGHGFDRRRIVDVVAQRDGQLVALPHPDDRRVGNAVDDIAEAASILLHRQSHARAGRTEVGGEMARRRRAGAAACRRRAVRIVNLRRRSGRRRRIAGRSRARRQGDGERDHVAKITAKHRESRTDGAGLRAPSAFDMSRRSISSRTGRT